MIVLPDYFIDSARRDIIAGGSPMSVRRLIVWHFTGGGTAKSSIAAMRERGVSAHFVVERTGELYQCRALNLSAGHAGGPGKARWRDPSTGKFYNGVNGCGSIGIEIANYGDEAALAKSHGLPTPRTRYRPLHYQHRMARQSQSPGSHQRSRYAPVVQPACKDELRCWQVEHMPYLRL